MTEDSHLWKNFIEGVVGVSGIGAQVLDGSRTKAEELPTQEGVGEEQIANGDSKGQALAEEEIGGIASVGAEAGSKELHRALNL